jgi:hypothetical protein
MKPSIISIEAGKEIETKDLHERKAFVVVLHRVEEGPNLTCTIGPVSVDMEPRNRTPSEMQTDPDSSGKTDKGGAMLSDDDGGASDFPKSIAWKK